ncbi:hypothetical protein KA183_03505 [bacterium]|nr:hypothetical protein [bacterium]QQR59711.1 MAG: hypothetical protein IPG59_09550 [Candidatus Melainabacteria bacterium]
MDSLQAKDDDDLNFDKSGIQLRLDRLIEKQTKRYEALISSGNHGDAQRLLQIIWQLKQLRLPGTAEESSIEQSIPPDRYAPMLEPFLKDSLNDSQLSLLFEKKEVEPLQSLREPPIVDMVPSMPEILNTYPPGLPKPALTAQSVSPSPPPSIATVPPSSVPDINEFDEISSGEFDLDTNEMELNEVFHQPLQKTSSTQAASNDFEDESSEYDDPEANAPLSGLTTGHVPVVKKEDLINYRNEVRKTIDWEEEEEISTAKTKGKPKPYLREKVSIKSKTQGKEVDEDDDDALEQLDERVEFSDKSAPNKVLVTAAVVAVIVVFGGVAIYAFNSLSAPSFESLEKMGQQSDKSPLEMGELYSKAVKASPKEVRGWSGLSYWQSRQGQNFLALKSQANAVKLSPKDAKQWYALALLLKGCSNYKEALRAAKEAVALEPLNSQYSSLQEQVQEYNP